MVSEKINKKQKKAISIIKTNLKRYFTAITFSFGIKINYNLIYFSYLFGCRQITKRAVIEEIFAVGEQLDCGYITVEHLSISFSTFSQLYFLLWCHSVIPIHTHTHLHTESPTHTHTQRLSLILSQKIEQKRN